jgi:hypothetical protein
MAREKAPVLFGRRMKHTVGKHVLLAAQRWDLKVGPIGFTYTQFGPAHHRGTLTLDGTYYRSADRQSRAAALNWLTAQRDRLVKSLTPERG